MPTLEAVLAPQELTAALERRYAVKKFDPKGKIAPEKWQALERALQLAPSSYGLQPYKVIVVEDKALREKLRAASWNQGQIVDADKLVVFAARKGLGAADAKEFIARVAEVRGKTVAELAGFEQMLSGSIGRRSDAENQSWAARQAYIGLGLFLTAAAVLGVDACPMEGIDPAKYDELLGLSGYGTVMVATAGVRAADDAYAAEKKVRWPKERLFERR